MTSFFNRYFGKTNQSTSKKGGASTSSSISSLTSSTSSSSLSIPFDLLKWSGPEFNRDSIRLLVFSDSDDMGLELIFDSKTLRIVPPPDSENTVNRPPTANSRPSGTRPPTGTSNPTSKPPPGPSSNTGARLRPAVTRFHLKGKQYELTKAMNDTQFYADLIFGTTPVLFRGTGMKVHTRRSPLQIMMSRMSAVKLPDRPDTLIVNTTPLTEPETMPVNPFNPLIQNPLYRSLSTNGSIASSTISSIGVLGEDLTNQKFGRLYRRWLKCANQVMRQQKPRQPGRRHRRYIGMVFTVTFHQNETAKYKHFEEFFCSHAALIENHFQKIMIAAETHINERNAIAAALLDKFFDLKADLHILYTRPRLLSPAWYMFTQEQLSMSKRRSLAQQLCAIIDIFTTPKYGDFLNCVLSALLSYQLSWLATVSPSLIKSKQQSLFKNKADYMLSLQNYLQYSPLWGQLIDLFSAYGIPPYLCRTVLVGSDAGLLNRLLYLLSFFIRPSYLTYQIPSLELADIGTEPIRTYKRVRYYLTELIDQSVQIQDIEPYSPVHSIHGDDINENGTEHDDDIEILPEDELSINDIPTLGEQQNFYHLTFSSDDNESISVEEREVSQLIESLIEHIEQLIAKDPRPKIESPPKPTKEVSIPILNLPLPPPPPPLPKPVTNTSANKTLMSMSLFEPNLSSQPSVQIFNDYHRDLALSLIASVSSVYSSDFILQAIETNNNVDVLRAILEQHTYDITENGGLFLGGERIDTSITLLINLDEMSVNLYSSKHNDVPRRQERTTLIQPLLEQARLAKFLPADFVLLNMEDSLQEIYFQALAILKYMKANSTISNRDSISSSLGDSVSTTSVTSGDTDDKRSTVTNHTVTELTETPMINPILTIDSPVMYPSSLDNSSELVQNVIRKFQLQRSDYLFLKNILHVLETEQMQIID